jgi:hypothetical protein
MGGRDVTEDEEDEYEEITQEDCWTVISSFFDQKGLVRQQLDSFDEFVQNTMQELVDENSDLNLDQQQQHTGHEADSTRRYEIKFGQIYLSRPTVTEADGSVVPVFPQEARLRNLTYSAPLYIEMKKKVLVGREGPDGMPGEVVWEPEHEEAQEDSTKVWIGKVRCGSASVPILCVAFADSNNASVNVLHPSWPSRSGLVRLERVPLRLWRLLHYQWFRKGAHCTRAHGDQPCLRIRKSSTLANQFSGRDSERC